MQQPVNSNNDDWDIVISPRVKLFSLNLKAVWAYRDLLWLFVRRDFVAQYKQTILGPVWHIIQPVFTTIIFILIFSKIAQIPTNGIEPALFYMSGITIWNYFASCLTSSSNTFVMNAGIFGKVYFPRLVIPFSSILSNIIKFGIQFLLLLLMMAYFGFQNNSFYFSISFFLIPVLVLMMAALGLGIGIIISSLTTKYRDFTVLTSFGVQLLMYATPIAYPASYLDNKSYVSFINYNPLTPVVESFRHALFGTGTIDFTSLLYSGIFIMIVLLSGIIIFNRVERNFMDTV